MYINRPRDIKYGPLFEGPTKEPEAKEPEAKEPEAKEPEAKSTEPEQLTYNYNGRLVKMTPEEANAIMAVGLRHIEAGTHELDPSEFRKSARKEKEEDADEPSLKDVLSKLDSLEKQRLSEKQKQQREQSRKAIEAEIKAEADKYLEPSDKEGREEFTGAITHRLLNNKSRSVEAAAKAVAKAFKLKERTSEDYVDKKKEDKAKTALPKGTTPGMPEGPRPSKEDLRSGKIRKQVRERLRQSRASRVV